MIVFFVPKYFDLEMGCKSNCNIFGVEQVLNGEEIRWVDEVGRREVHGMLN